jgi:hypothetical protein
MATKRAIGIEVFGDDEPDEWEQDALLTRAIVDALRDMAEHPSSLQLSFERRDTFEADRQEFVVRTVAELERIRKQNPPELVRVREKVQLDEATGVVFSEAVAILGPITPRQRSEMLKAAAA